MDENFIKSAAGQPESIPIRINSEIKTGGHAGTDGPMAAPLTKAEPVANETPLEKNFNSAVDPMPVVKVLSTRGVEYAMLTITLWLNAIGLLWILLALVNGGARLVILDVPLSIMIICVPVFGYLFLRRKKAELADPSLKREPSKRRWTQFSQFLAFLATLANLITLVYLVIGKIAGQVHYHTIKIILDSVIILVVTGGVLAYYWHDEHRLKIS